MPLSDDYVRLLEHHMDPSGRSVFLTAILDLGPYPPYWSWFHLGPYQKLTLRVSSNPVRSFMLVPQSAQSGQNLGVICSTNLLPGVR